MTKIVKICGLRDVEAASKAIELGADLLGVIMVPNRKRTVAPDVAKMIAELARQKRKSLSREFSTAREIVLHMGKQKFVDYNDYFTEYHRLITENGPFLVGVFRNQDPEEVFELANNLSLDFIQLHGSEDLNTYLELNKYGKFCIIKRFVIPSQVELMESVFESLLSQQNKGYALPLLDSELGGEGSVIDWSLLNDLKGKFLLAGGLTPDNLHETVPFSKNLVGFDVSGGVEDANGDKNLTKIEQFVTNGKHL